MIEEEFKGAIGGSDLTAELEWQVFHYQRCIRGILDKPEKHRDLAVLKLFQKDLRQARIALAAIYADMAGGWR